MQHLLFGGRRKSKTDSCCSR